MGRHRGKYEDDEGRTPRRSSGGGRRRRARGGAFIALAAAFAIILGLGGTGWYLLNRQGGCGGQDIALDVAVSPELVPTMQDISADFNGGDHAVDGRCVKAEVRGADSANVTYGITGAGPTMGDTESDVWIPDSSLWPNMAKDDSGEGAFTDTGTSVASSPLILAQPAGTVEESAKKPSWDALVPTAAPASGEAPNDVRLIDPVRSASGMATLALISDSIGEEEAGQPQLVAALQALQRGVSANEEEAFSTLSEKSDGSSRFLVLSEQAAWRYNNEHPDSPAQVHYPEGGTYTLDYPYIVRASDPVVSRAAELLRESLTRKAAQQAFIDNGFRSAKGTADPDVLSADAGFQEEAPENLPPPSATAVDSLTQAWNQLKLDTRLLTIVDISGSMLEPVPGTDMNRMDVTRAASIEGLNLFPEDSELGLWQFSVQINNELDYEELLPVRELSADVDGRTQKEAITEAWTSIQPKPDGDTGLYDTYLAAYREMSRSYKADRINSILMLTDGNNDDANSITLEELIATLQDESSAERPIPIFTIAFGPDIDPQPLEQIAEITGGAAYTTEDPTEIGDIFLEAFSQRLDTPGDGEGE